MDKESFPSEKADKERVAVVLDTDVGTDDALAILLSRFLPGVRFDYIVTAKGNTTLDGAVRNAILLRQRLGLDARIVCGRLPKAGTNFNEEEKNDFHGSDGLGGIREQMIERLGLTERHLGDFLTYEEYSRQLLSFDRIDCIVIGPPTNLANALDDGILADKLRKVFIMGGGINEFNCSHGTEFNFSKDPASIKKILDSKIELTLFPLDLTNHQRVSSQQIDALEKTGAFGEFISMLRFNRSSNRAYNGIDAAVLHDAMPVLFLAYPEKFTVEEKKLTVDRFGATKPDDGGRPVRVATDVEKDLLNSTLSAVFTQNAPDGRK